MVLLCSKEMKEEYTLTIQADSRPGLLHLVSGIIEKKLIMIISFNLQRPAADGTAIITTTVMIDVADLKNLALKLENIVEVFSVTVSESDRVTIADTPNPNSVLTAEMESVII